MALSRKHQLWGSTSPALPDTPACAGAQHGPHHVGTMLRCWTWCKLPSFNIPRAFSLRAAVCLPALCHMQLWSRLALQESARIHSCISLLLGRTMKSDGGVPCRQSPCNRTANSKSPGLIISHRRGYKKAAQTCPKTGEADASAAASRWAPFSPPFFCALKITAWCTSPLVACKMFRV